MNKINSKIASLFICLSLVSLYGCSSGLEGEAKKQMEETMKENLQKTLHRFKFQTLRPNLIMIQFASFILNLVEKTVLVVFPLVK